MHWRSRSRRNKEREYDMITVLPMKTAEEQQIFLQTHTVCDGYNCLYRAEERGKEVGWFSLFCAEERVTILELEVNGCTDENCLSEDDQYIIELLVRTAASYGANHMAMFLQYNDFKFREFLQRFGFCENAYGAFELEIAKLLHGGGHCNHS